MPELLECGAAGSVCGLEGQGWSFALLHTIAVLEAHAFSCKVF